MQTRVELCPVPIQYALVPDCEIETPLLPRDHPAWVRDAIAMSARAREWVAKIKPIAIRVMTFWDHAVRSINVMGRTLSVDASGSYRLD